jgi:hypothetical protein
MFPSFNQFSPPSCGNETFKEAASPSKPRQLLSATGQLHGQDVSAAPLPSGALAA